MNIIRSGRCMTVQMALFHSLQILILSLGVPQEEAWIQ